MDAENDFIGSRYTEACERLVSKTLRISQRLNPENPWDGYEHYKEKIRHEIEGPTSCYHCLRRIEEESIIQHLSLSNQKRAYFFFHESCLDALVNEYMKKKETAVSRKN